MVASWISGENAAHPSSSSTTWYPRSAASRAVVSTQTLVTTPPTTRDEMPSARSRWSRPVELNVPYVVLFTTSSPGCGSRLLTMRAQGSARGGMAASPTAALLEVAQHARNDGLAGQRERRGGIQEILLHVDEHERGRVRIERERSGVAMALKRHVPVVRGRS